MALRDKANDQWVRRFHQSSDNRARLICFPHAGGSASYYFPYSQSLAPEIEVLAIQYPGRQDRRNESFIDSIAVLADRIHQALEERGGGPAAFFGHSMGAIVAYEVALRMRKHNGTSPTWFFASGRRAPSRRREGAVHRRDDAGLVAELAKVGGTNQQFLADPELLAGILPVTRNDYRAIETYAWRPAPPLDCPATVFVGDRDPQTTLEEATAWEDHFTDGCAVEVFSGGHFYLDQHRPALLGKVSEALLGEAGRKSKSFEGSTS